MKSNVGLTDNDRRQKDRQTERHSSDKNIALPISKVVNKVSDLDPTVNKKTYPEFKIFKAEKIYGIYSYDFFLYIY